MPARLKQRVISADVEPATRNACSNFSQSGLEGSQCEEIWGRRQAEQVRAEPQLQTILPDGPIKACKRSLRIMNRGNDLR